MIGLKAYVLAAVAAIVLGSVTLYVITAERAKAQVRVLEARLAQAELAASQNSKAAEACRLVNEANAREVIAQRDRAVAAERRAAASQSLADRDAREVELEAQAHRNGGLECPAVNDDFRRWLRGDP